MDVREKLIDVLEQLCRRGGVTMAGLIDADALGIGKANEAIFKVRDYVHGWNSAIKNTDNAPTVDAVPVVRCRECKHLMFSDCYGECGKGHMGIVSPDDFCSYGERK